MDNFFLNRVVDEIAPKVTGQRVQGISVYGLNFEIGLGGGALVVCLDPAGPGLFYPEHIRRARKRAATATEAAAVRCLGRLAGAEVTGISKEPFDRIVRVEFSSRDEGTVSLILMLTGRSANAYLETESGNREAMLPDRSAQDAAGPAGEVLHDWHAAGENMEPGSAQASACATFSPALKAELLFRSKSIAPAEALISLLDDLEQRPAPLIYSRLPIEEVGRRAVQVKSGLLLSCIELASVSGMRRYEFDSFAEAAQSYYRLVAQAGRFEREHDALRRKLASEMKKSRATLAAVEADLKKFEEPERFKRYGDLILANLATTKIERGRVRVRDYYETDAPEIEIEIGDCPTLQKASSQFYSRYRKAQRGLKALRPREQALKDRVRALEEMMAVVSADPVIDRMREIGAQFDALTGIRRPAAAKPDKKKEKAGKEVGRWFTTSDGYDVVVGRNDRENDIITFRLASSQDIWLHAADYPGSHVVVRNPRREAVPFKTILEAAAAAAFYSQARKESKAAVHYTQKKYVSKPPRSKPGLARLSSFKTVLVEPKKR